MKEIYVGKGKYAIVDDEDYEYLSELSWHCTKDGYPTSTDNCKWGGQAYSTSYRMHKIITMTLFSGTSAVVDHINGNPLDNRKSNLRICTVAENSKNRKLDKRNKSGCPGVRFKYKRWEASIKSGDKTIYASFKTKEEAIQWRMAREKDLYKEFAPSNRVAG